MSHGAVPGHWPLAASVIIEPPPHQPRQQQPGSCEDGTSDWKLVSHITLHTTSTTLILVTLGACIMFSTSVHPDMYLFVSSSGDIFKYLKFCIKLALF